MNFLNTQTNFRDWVEAHPELVTRTESTTQPGLFVLKYHRRVFFDNLWTPELEYCRGLVLDADWNIVVQPFRKIYNRFERGMDFQPDDEVVYYRKVNGFMASMTWLPDSDRLIISTTGSLDSDFVQMAREVLFSYRSEEDTKKVLRSGINGKPWPQITFLFEIVHANDPHIVRESLGAYQLAFNVPVYYEDQPSNDLHATHFYSHCDQLLTSIMGYKTVSVNFGRFKEVVERARHCNHEGFVVYDQAWNPRKALKIKSPFYLVTKFFARKTEAKLTQILNDTNWPQHVDEEFYPLVSHLRDNKSHFIELDEQGRIALVNRWFVDTLRMNH